MQKKQYLAATFTGIVLIGASLALFRTKPVAAQTERSAVVFTADGKLQLPTGYRRWVFVGAPLTPNALNGMASLCIRRAKEPGRISENPFVPRRHSLRQGADTRAFPDGPRTEPSGRGNFNGELNGIDVTVKNSKRFPNSNGWGFFTFGHHPLPYAESAKESPVTECAFCHMANVAKTDMTWVRFYRLLRDDLTTARRRTAREEQSKFTAPMIV